MVSFIPKHEVVTPPPRKCPVCKDYFSWTPDRGEYRNFLRRATCFSPECAKMWRQATEEERLLMTTDLAPAAQPHKESKKAKKASTPALTQSEFREITTSLGIDIRVFTESSTCRSLSPEEIAELEAFYKSRDQKSKDSYTPSHCYE